MLKMHPLRDDCVDFALTGKLFSLRRKMDWQENFFCLSPHLYLRGESTSKLWILSPKALLHFRGTKRALLPGKRIFVPVFLISRRRKGAREKSRLRKPSSIKICYIIQNTREERQGGKWGEGARIVGNNEMEAKRFYIRAEKKGSEKGRKAFPAAAHSFMAFCHWRKDRGRAFARYPTTF